MHMYMQDTQRISEVWNSVEQLASRVPRTSSAVAAAAAAAAAVAAPALPSGLLPLLHERATLPGLLAWLPHGRCVVRSSVSGAGYVW
jgi:hypothetical protein